MSQSQSILEHLQAGNSITPLGALARFGCNRLAARICELRKEGWAIEREMIAVPESKWVARYRMKRDG